MQLFLDAAHGTETNSAPEPPAGTGHVDILMPAHCHPLWTSDHQDCLMINFYCLKPLALRQGRQEVTTAIIFIIEEFPGLQGREICVLKATILSPKHLPVLLFCIYLGIYNCFQIQFYKKEIIQGNKQYVVISTYHP